MVNPGKTQENPKNSEEFRKIWKSRNIYEIFDNSGKKFKIKIQENSEKFSKNLKIQENLGNQKIFTLEKLELNLQNSEKSRKIRSTMKVPSNPKISMKIE